MLKNKFSTLGRKINVGLEWCAGMRPEPSGELT